MAKNITLMGANYSDVPAVDLPQTGGGTARFSDASVTTAIASDVAQGKIFLNSHGQATTGTASGGGGGGIGTLIKTQSLGTITASGSNEADTGISLSVSSVNDYDLLIVETSVDTVVNGRHMATVRMVWLTGTSSVGTKNTVALAGGVWNAKVSSDGVKTTRQYSTAYGVFPKDQSISDGTVTMEMYKRYNSTYTNTVNGTYTTRVYGVKLYDLIGG